MRLEKVLRRRMWLMVKQEVWLKWNEVKVVD